MKKYLNKFHMTVIATSILVLSVSYFVSLACIDSIVVNYDIVSSTASMTDNPFSLQREIENLEKQLTEKSDLLELLKSRRPFYSNLFKDLSMNYHCEITELETSESPKDKKIQYRIVYSGKLKHLMNLLNELETKYHVNVQKAGINAASVDGSILRLVILLQVANND
ncbi:MAG: hypothetical protein GY834_17190 [Bacteroidetes bacterium]|nr:hypothetical protein [Bacteroidota bacterium]